MVKQNKRLNAPSNIKHRFGFVILTIIILVQTYFLVITRIELKQLVNFPIKELITQALDGLYSDIPKDAKAGAYYIESAKLTLPKTNNLNHRFGYSFTPKSENGDFGEEIHINVKNIVSKAKVEMYNSQNLEDTFNAVPKLQACARGFLLKFEDKQEDHEYGEIVFSKTLDDGRNLYVRQDKGCTEDVADALNYLKQINSY